MKRNLLSLFVVAALLLTLCAPCALAADPDSLAGYLVILHTNDIHGRALADLEEPSLGYARIAEIRDEFEARGAKVLLLDAGDFSQGTPIVNLSQGATAVDFMNAAGYDAATLGNHEFDWGPDALRQHLEKANFKVVCANILNRADNEPLFSANAVFDLGEGMKVGVFGLDTPETLTKANPERMKDIAIGQGAEMYAEAQAQVEALKAENCDLIVCLGHLGADEASEPNRSTDLIANVSGIDLFIDGHSHTEMNEQIGDTLLVRTGCFGHNLGVVRYGAEGFAASLMPVYAEDDAVKELVTGVNGEIQEELSAVFATSTVELNGQREFVRTGETNLGDLATDAILWSAKQSMGDAVVAAVTNGGGIRDSLAAGELTMLDLKIVFPFGNHVAVLTVTGAELLEALEASTYDSPNALGSFPQVSGIVFSVDTSVAYEAGEAYPDSTYFAPAKPGSRVTIESVGGQPFDPEALYTIATNDFTAAGGDTYYVFRYAYATSGYDTGVALEDALDQYIGTVLNDEIGAQYAPETANARITVK